ncbi:DNA polymerase III subunit chi [Alkalimarinus coralli]|uniref:DNA polymerase III subunit chi n=1 Tax=Alkalimarinus coralli TaxID=2935863 RepID=UPI00202B7C41|nr:DNA polymerase III subunit chi [Alkalimarinus coralli]
MAKADFYILNSSDHRSRLEFLCRLIEKTTKLGHKIYIHTNNEQQATDVDDYLWTYKIESFLPHDLSTDAPPSAPVTIGFSNDCQYHNDLLINLASELPAFYKNFERVAEIVTQDDKTLKELRSHYRQIKNDGIEALIHDFRQK